MSTFLMKRSRPFAIALAMAVTSQTAMSAQAGQRRAPLICSGQAFVTNSAASSLSIIDTHSEAVVKIVKVGQGPVNPVLSPDGSRLYVANSGAKTISVIDVGSRAVIATLPAGELKPSGLAVTPDGKRLVITFFGAQPPRDTNKPAKQGIQTIPMGKRVVTLFGDEIEVPGAVRVMDLSTGKLGEPILVGGGPERIALTPKGNRAYVANLHSGTVSVVDFDRKAAIATIPTGYSQTFNVKVSRRGDRVFVGNVSGNRVVVIDTSTNRIIKSFATDGGPNGIALSPDEKRLYFTNGRAGSVQYVDTSTWKLSAPVKTDPSPGYIALTPDGKKALFVMPMGSSVKVLDLASMTVTRSIETERGPSVVTVCGSP
jgi:YVTN family beta-propeller protein